ncbi:DUF2470 domain-containing protein [Streptomyces sp. BI20]|uniref:DUF2470 domain-containing protein n=1 Tax=Streptomyces sp. BI20 TaxID=3403460 RepID=UPI003C70B719
MRMFGAPAAPIDRPTRPTAAERVRSVLVAAHSMTLVTEGVRTEIRQLDGSDVLGRFHLHPAGPGPTPAEVIGRPRVTMEFTDVAPTPVRDRVRARVTVTGLLLTPYTGEVGDSVCVEYGQAVLESAEGRFVLGLDELDTAHPDPLAAFESGMLTHLLDEHGELVTLLLRLVPPAALTGVRRALPLALDRHGVTLRLEGADPAADRDVRLPFASPLEDVEQSGAQIQALLTKARRMSHRNSLPA